MNQHETFRYRIRFGKEDSLRYTSHLDVARIWERVLRRVGLPLVYSQGFNPRPRLQLAQALPLGFASTGEWLDIWLEDPIDDLNTILPQLRSTAPGGLLIFSIELVDTHDPALQSISDMAVYRIVVGNALNRVELTERVDELLEQTEIKRVRRGKEYDLRPLIDTLVIPSGDPLRIEARLSASPQRGTGRADEVVDALGLDPTAISITRIALEFGPVLDS